MADLTHKPPSKNRIISAIANWASQWSSNQMHPSGQASDLGMDSSYDYDMPAMSVLLGNGGETARSRAVILQKYQQMIGDPIISAAIRLHVTSALGGHESKGEMIFIEATPAAQKDKTKMNMVTEIASDLSAHLNRIAPTLAFNGCTFGDSYARMYSRERVGILDIYCDEMVYPPLVQPYERGNSTIGYRVNTSVRAIEELNIAQLARCKMPRLLYQPQMRVVEKALRLMLKEDDLDKIPALPSLVGGSFLDGAETAYDNLSTAMASLVGARLLDSIDESMIFVQNEGMSKQQRKEYKDGLTRIFQRSIDYAKKVVLEKKPALGKIRHLIPVFNEKQMVISQAGMNSGASGSKQSYTVDDVMMQARLLAGSLGIDLSMLGFADQMSGGLGDGGFFRVSAQAAERSRAIRMALTECFDHIINVHLLYKHGISFDGNDKPWQVTYHSGISSMEKEKADTLLSKINSGGLLLQSLTGMRELGFDEPTMVFLLKQQFGLDEEEAKMYATGLANAPKPDEAQGGGFGGQ
jgi:hypothetical protein